MSDDPTPEARIGALEQYIRELEAELAWWHTRSPDGLASVAVLPAQPHADPQ